MSEGLRLLSAIIATGSSGQLLRTDAAELLDTEATAYQFIRNHFRSYRELPSAATVLEETGVRLPVVSEPLLYYVDRVNERHDYGIIRDRFALMRESLTQRDMTGVSQHISAMSGTLNRRRRGGANAGEAVSISEGIRQVTSRLSSIRGTGGISGITTGWPSYDYITGGYQNSDLITLVGRMGLGKTYLLLRQAQKAHEAGESVLFVTTEMSIEQMARRFAALSLGINPKLLRDGTISTYMAHRIESLVTGIASADRFKLFSVGMDAKVSAIHALIEEFCPSIVYIDGIYLLKPTEFSRNMNRTERVAGVYDEVKGGTLEFQIPYVVTTQFSRQAGKGGKDGSLETISFSDAIGTHSSAVAAIKLGNTERPGDSRIFDFLKGREGEAGEVEINFKFAPLDMDERTPEQRTDEGEVSTDINWMLPRRSATT